MSKRPFIPLYIADFLAETARLDTDQRGAYLLLMMEYWSSGSLPDDDAQLARVVGWSAKKFAQNRNILSAFFDDGWVHPKLDELLEKTTKTSETNSEKAKRAADRRWSKHRSSMPQALPEAKPIDATSDSRKKESSSESVESLEVTIPPEDLARWEKRFNHLSVKAEVFGLVEWCRKKKLPATISLIERKLSEKQTERLAQLNPPEQPKSLVERMAEAKARDDEAARSQAVRDRLAEQARERRNGRHPPG